MSRVTFKFPEEMVENHKPRKEAMGVSWPEYFDGQAPDVEFATPEDVRQIVREECGAGSGSTAGASNDDLLTEIKTLREQINGLTENGSRY